MRSDTPAGIPLADITVSVVLHNSLRLLQARQAFFAALPKLCLLDNASHDGSAEWIAAQLPTARLLRCPDNIGFGRGHNLALADCYTPFALLLNPDCDITLPAIQQLAAGLADHEDALMAVPRLCYPDGREQDNYRAFTIDGGRPLKHYQPPAGPACYEMVSGAAMLVHLPVFRALGGFDPWFFLYWEDEDLCYRARRAGHAVILDPRVVAFHAEKKSSLPSARTSFLRHYSYATGKLYLRRRCGESRSRIALRMAGLMAAGLLGLLPDALRLQPERALRRVAVMAAALTAPWQLCRTRAAATPLQLFARRSP